MSRSQGTVWILRRTDSPLSYGQQVDQRMLRAGTLRQEPPTQSMPAGKPSGTSSSTSPEDSIKLLDDTAAEFWDLLRSLSSGI